MRSFTTQLRRGHTLLELMVASAASVVLLSGLAAVMMIGRQVAYTPTAAERRVHAAKVVNQIAEELRYATFVVQQAPRILEFVVADRNGDGAAERIRYEWSGRPGDPLTKRINASTDLVILDAVYNFTTTLQLNTATTTLKTNVTSGEMVLQANTTVPSGDNRSVSPTLLSAQQINPASFPSVPANAISWNATRVDFHGRNSGSTSEVLLLQLRHTGEPSKAPTDNLLGQISIPETSLTSNNIWNTAEFTTPVRDLAFHRSYALVWAGLGSGEAARLLVWDGGGSGGVLESNDSGASWQFMTNRQLYYRLYGTYTTPGPSYTVSRSFASHVLLTLQTSEQSHARLESRVPLPNTPELLSAYWRADFDQNPTTSDLNADGMADWVVGSGSFDATRLINGIWHPANTLQSRPPNDFYKVTIVEARCRNTSVGGNGAVLRINADRQGGLYAPLLVHVQRQADGTQTLTLLGKPSDPTTITLHARDRLSADFVRFRLIILPQHDVVNLTINDEDQGTFSYPTYPPSNASGRQLAIWADGSLAEFDYVDLRVTP